MSEPSPAKSDFGNDTGGGFGGEEPAPSDDKPFDNEPFDAGVEADEDSDPKKFIEQLTGKLGQSLRTYNDKQGQPDFELEKFAINSLLSATHTSEMDAEDQDDIVKKVKEAGQNDTKDTGEDFQSDEESNSDGFDSDDTEDTEGFDSEGDLEENLFEKEEGFLIKPKKSSIFAPEGSEEANFKNKIVEKLHENFNQENMNSEPMVEPQVKPAPQVVPAPDKVQPNIVPSRKNKPFLPMPQVQPNPKAIKEGKFDYETYHKTLSITLNEVKKYVLNRGFDPIEFDINDVQHVAYGHTERFNKELTKNGKPLKHSINIQIYRMDSGTYELNMYIA